MAKKADKKCSKCCDAETVVKVQKMKTLAKTIKKPQTVDVIGLNVVSVTLTDKGTLTIKYVK